MSQQIKKIKTGKKDGQLLIRIQRRSVMNLFVSAKNWILVLLVN